jgi:hypothetical protein
MDWDKALKKLPDRDAPERDPSSRPVVQTLDFEALDDATQAYLRQVRESGGHGMPGIYAPKTNYLPVAGLIIGFVLIIIGALITLPPGPFDEPVGTALLQMAFLLPAVWMIVAAFRVWGGSSKSAGHFVYADACRLYDCNGAAVKIVELEGMTEADGTHNYNEGKYQNTAITMQLDRGKQSITVHAEEPGRQLIVFLNCINWIDGSELKSLPPHVRGALAREVALTGQMPTSLNESDVAVSQVPEPQQTGAGRSGIVAYLLIVGLTVGGLLLLIPFNRNLRDDTIFESVTAPGHGGPRDLRAYLIAVPDGKHREEIERRLAAHYQGALNTLRAAAPKSDLAKGPLEIVEGIKTATHPGVSIRVREQHEAHPGLYCDRPPGSIRSGHGFGAASATGIKPRLRLCEAGAPGRGPGPGFPGLARRLAHPGLYCHRPPGSNPRGFGAASATGIKPRLRLCEAGATGGEPRDFPGLARRLAHPGLYCHRPPGSNPWVLEPLRRLE